MNQLRLKSILQNHFRKAWMLYEDAFPAEERRELNEQIRILKFSNYHFDVIIDDDKLNGFLLWWDFETLRYIEYFAIASEQRNKGFGKQILENFIATNNKAVLLEVELPNSTINQRRIKFYERVGFKLNQHYYETPPLKKDLNPLQFLLMTYPALITKKEVEQFVKTYHPILYKN